MKLYVSKADIAYQFAQAKLFLEIGNVSVAEDCKNVLWGWWNKLNSGLIDVEDIQWLYERLHILSTNIRHVKAEAYDRRRKSCEKM